MQTESEPFIFTKRSTKTKSSQTDAAKTNAISIQTEPPKSNEISIQTEPTEEHQEPMEMSVISPDYDDIIEKQNKRISELDTKLKKYKGLLFQAAKEVSERKAKEKVIKPEGFKKRKLDDSERPTELKGQQKFERLLKQHQTEPKSSYSFATEILPETSELQVSSRIIQDPLKKEKSRDIIRQWTPYNPPKRSN